jgi:non-reducing end alpha-L-arabinofuranosidase
MVRKMSASYAGAFFQIERYSDSTTLNVYAGPSGIVNTQPIWSFCQQTTCTVSEIYDQMGTPSSGNNLPQTTVANQGLLGWVNSPYGQLPEVVINTNDYYRNRTATVHMPTGSSNITEYMVVDTKQQGSACCGTYGNMEATVADTGKGHMFALAYASGAEGTYGLGTGQWPGVDWEQGVYMYGAVPSASVQTILAKYNTSGPSWEVRTAGAVQGSFSTLYSGSLPSGYTAQFEGGGGLSLGEGGDGSTAPVDFLEGAILASASADTVDDSVQTSISQIFSQTNTIATSGDCSNASQSFSIAPTPLTLTSWTTNNTSATSATDPNGGSTAALVTGTTGAHNANIEGVISANVTPNAFYTFTAWIKATSSATVFPGGSIQFNGGPQSSAEFAWALNTNNGTVMQGAWGAENTKVNYVGATLNNGWYVVKMIFQAPAGVTSLDIFLDPPVISTLSGSGAGVRVNQSTGLTATYYCPLLRQGWIQ